jgi:hypothetical protein
MILIQLTSSATHRGGTLGRWQPATAVFACVRKRGVVRRPASHAPAIPSSSSCAAMRLLTYLHPLSRRANWAAASGGGGRRRFCGNRPQAAAAPSPRVSPPRPAAATPMRRSLRQAGSHQIAALLVPPVVCASRASRASLRRPSCLVSIHAHVLTAVVRRLLQAQQV